MLEERIAYNEAIARTVYKIKPLADALREILAQHPEAPAVIQGNKIKSYRQLSEAAQDIAFQLFNAGITPGQRIILDLPRSMELYEMILGCLIAGVSFISLPRGFGQSEKIREAKKANCAGILSDVTLFTSGGLRINGSATLWKLPTFSMPTLNKVSDEVYCVRTSGTTGEPKVVPANSANLSAFLQNSQNALGISKYARWLWIHDLSFDFSIWDTLACLAHCGCLVILDECTKHDPKATLNLIAKTKVNILTVTPSEFKFIFFSESTPPNLDNFCFTDIIIGGERLAPSTFSPLFHQLNQNGVRWFNVYGPTETTVFCSYHHIRQADLELESIPIGKPFPGIEFNLMSPDDLGVGELNIRGAQVFEGYDGSRLLTDGYHTGDICRLDDDGRFVFVGRSGGYQKVNGFRVKPYEIEEHLQSHPNVDEAVIFIEQSNDHGDYLLAYIRVRRGAELSTRELRLHCSTLPPYLRPVQYLLLQDEAWPINDRGKTDKKNLRRNSHE